MPPEVERRVDGRRAVIGFGLTAVIAFAANYFGDTTGHHAARGAILGATVATVGLLITWWISRGKPVPEI